MKSRRKKMKLRKREKEELSDEARRTLETLDAAAAAAVAGDSPQVGDDKAREMVELGTTLREARSKPSEEFAGRMEEQLAKGFRGSRDEEQAGTEAKPHDTLRGRLARPFRAISRLRRPGMPKLRRPGMPKLRRPVLPKLRRPRLGLAVAASLLLALAVSVAVIRTSGDEGTGDIAARQKAPAPPATRDSETGGTVGGEEGDGKVGGREGLAQPDSSGGAEAPGDDFMPPEPPVTDPSMGKKDRKVEITAALTLKTREDRIQEVADRVIKTTDRHGGVVMSSQITVDSGKQDRATFDLRVPVDKVKSTLADLSALADVQFRTQASSDITGSFVSIQDSLKSLRAERKSLLRRLENANTDRQAELLRQRLNNVAARINSSRSQLKSLRERTGYARIDVTLAAKTKSSESSGGWGTGDALNDALYTMVQGANFAIRLVGVLIPLGLLAVVIWLVGRTAIRRRRESTLE